MLQSEGVYPVTVLCKEPCQMRLPEITAQKIKIQFMFHSKVLQIIAASDYAGEKQVVNKEIPNHRSGWG